MSSLGLEMIKDTYNGYFYMERYWAKKKLKRNSSYSIYWAIINPIYLGVPTEL